MDQANKKIIAELNRRTAYRKNMNITGDTELYYDLRIFGDDLYEFFIWLAKEFKVEVNNINIDDYGPREGRILNIFHSRRYQTSHRYKSLKVRDIIAMIGAE